MTKFNPENKEELSHEEAMGPAMNITEQEDADQYLKDYIEFLQKIVDKAEEDPGVTTEEMAKGNLGYYAGYHDDDTRKRVEKLFKCKHPVFGAIEEHGPVTPGMAFELGHAIGSGVMDAAKG